MAFLDSNFPVNVKRAVEIARGFIESKVRFDWTFQASTDLLCRMSDDEVCLLGQSGVTHMGFGTESASERVLEVDEQEASADRRNVRDRAKVRESRGSG